MVEWPPIASPTDVPDAFAKLDDVAGYLTALIVEAKETYAPPPQVTGLAGELADVTTQAAIYLGVGLVGVRAQVLELIKAVDSPPRPDLLRGDDRYPVPFDPEGRDRGLPRMRPRDAAWAYWSNANGLALLQERSRNGRGNDRAGRRALQAHIADQLVPDLLLYGWYGDQLVLELHEPLGPNYLAAVREHEVRLAAWRENPPLPPPLEGRPLTVPVIPREP